jgi:hypothetical protein
MPPMPPPGIAGMAGMSFRSPLSDLVQWPSTSPAGVQRFGSDQANNGHRSDIAKVTRLTRNVTSAPSIDTLRKAHAP